jgi:pSer/pThr/pTyr-binding forkhead associated (FHA) protein
VRIYLDVIAGPNKGQKFSLTAKTSLGRKGADILLDDPKLSGIHAFLTFSEDSGWQVLDHQSRNGVWVNGLKETKAVLRDGDRLVMGSTEIEIRLVEAGAVEFSEKFQIWIQNLFKKLSNNKHPGQVEVRPEIRLKVIQGIQYGEVWEIFYGPRQAGRDSTDICLYDEKAPRDCFEVRVKGKYAYFYTNNENLVRLNNEMVKEKQMTPGDIISFGETRIEVEINE